MAMSMLEAALTFFADKMRILLTILTTDITTYEGGVIWNAISSVYDAILAIGVTVAVDSLSLGKGILLFVVVLIGAIFIVVSTIGVLLTVYYYRNPDTLSVQKVWEML